MNRLGSSAGVSHVALLLTGSTVGALALTLLRVPAGTLVGAVVGSAVVNRLHRPPPSPRGLLAPVRVVGLVLLGCAVGARLDTSTLGTLRQIAIPLALSIVALLLLDLALAVVLVRRYDIDPLTAVMACAPGGVSAIAITASHMGARMGVVLAIHSARVLAVVLLVLPVLVVLLGAP